MDKKSEINILKLLIKSNWKDRKDISIKNYIKQKIKDIKSFE